MNPLRIGIVAGEASGDILGAGLIRSIKAQYPDAEFVGIGGNKMLSSGCVSLFSMEELSIMGLVEVLSRIRRLLHIRKTLVTHFLDNPPDIFIGIDAPDFNLGLEMKLKKRGIKTIHYVSPSVWAWREKRVFKIAKATNLVLSLFPFEKAFYDKFQVPCQFVGHTLADDIPLNPDKNLARSKLAIDDDMKVLAVLPGSRGSEVSMLLDTFIQTAELLIKDIPELIVLIPVVNKERYKQVDQYLVEQKVHKNVRIVIGHSHEVLVACDAVLLASGTASLEAMLCKRPMVVAYKIKPVTASIMRRLYKPEFFSLPNLLANQALVPELIQDQVEPNHIATLLKPMLVESNKELMEQFKDIHLTLRNDANSAAAKAVIGVLNG
jgi:lipid-A-disaccharide synthase